MNFGYPHLKALIKASPRLKRGALASVRMLGALAWQFKPSAFLRYCGFLRDWRRFIGAGGKAAFLDFYPCLFDKVSATKVDSHYFHQSIWAFRLIKQGASDRHVDIASDVNFVGLLTTITEVVFVDIRPLFLKIPHYQGLGASITSLPFPDSSIPSLSCMHVIEHIGLGRYGDPIDPLGPEKACREITRVLRPGGNAYVSIPVGRPRVSFNGLRVFSAIEVIDLFSGLDLREMALVDVPGNFFARVNPGSVDIHDADGGMDFGLGLFWFSKSGHSIS